MNSNRVLLVTALIALAVTVACGTGGGVHLPRPQGNFSNSSLNGNYVYHIHGFDSTGLPYRQVGVFTADGSGHITGGSDDSSFGGSTSLSGNYQVVADGTGSITLNSGGSSIVLAITMVSTGKVQLIEADGFANARGTAEFQPPGAISAASLNGTYVFGLHQEISVQNQAPAAEVGSLAISGGSATGNMDENLGGSFSSSSITATFSTPAALGRGTGSLVNGSSTIDFIYYIVDDTKFIMLVSDVNAVGSGSAELQSGAVANGLSGNYVYGTRGDDSNFFAGVAAVGQFNAASGTLTGTEDFNVDGDITTNSGLSSCYTPSASGRVVINDLSGNTCSAGISRVFWMVNPARAFFLTTSNTEVEDGTADLQTTQIFSTSTFLGQYSLAMDGWDVFNGPFSAELLSRVGTLQFDGAGDLTLNEVVNASNSGAGGQTTGNLTGTYSVSSNGRITGTLDNGTLNLVMYAVSPSQAYVLQVDDAAFTSGMVQLQQ